MTTGLSAPSGGERLGFRVEGMDCASCVGKIETALNRLGGITDVTVNFATETLQLSRDTASTTTSNDIARKIRALGFDVTELPPAVIPSTPARHSEAHSGHDHSGCSGEHDHGHDHHHAHHHDHSDCGGHDHGQLAQTPVSRTDPTSPPNVSMRVEGMDCASCVGKIEVALARMPDVSDIRVNFTTEMLELNLVPGSGTKVADIERTIKSLGFGVSNTRELSSSSDVAVDVAPAPAMRNQRWWQTRKGKHVIGLGLLMGSAYLIAQFIPLYAEWIFALAVVAGVLPFARKAFALATSGSPFSIETLMSVAAIGALVIGEAEEAAAVVFLFAVG